MNNTTNLAIATAIMLVAATLVVGTFATTTTLTQTALAYNKKDNKRDAKDGDNGGNDNGNTVTIQKCKQAAIQSGFDNNQGQECENLICTHPGDNATCVQEGAAVAPQTPTPEPTPITTTLTVIKKVVCQPTHPNCSLPPICNITVTSASAGPLQTFQCESAIGNGVVVTLQPGDFFISFELPIEHFDVSFEGDCSGIIAEGQHLTCTITNTEPEEG